MTGNSNKHDEATSIPAVDNQVESTTPTTDLKEVESGLDNDPYEKVYKQLERFINWADKHWEYASRQSQPGKARRHADDDVSFFIAQSEEQKQSVIELLDAFCWGNPVERLPVLHASLIELNGNQKQHFNNKTIELEMYQKLGLWLCTYFLGIPFLNIWEEVSVLADRIGAYPGAAFYDKMAGDIYRYERRQSIKNPTTPREAMYVMTFIPLLLIPDKDDFIYTAADGKKEFFSTQDCVFAHLVDKLAYRYLQFQAWRFYHCKTESRALVYYGVSQFSTVKALITLADMKYRKEILKTEKSVLEKSDRDTPEWKSIFDNMKSSSDDRVKLYLSSVESKCELAVFPTSVTQRQGLTSCILGEEDGAITNRPNRVSQFTVFSSWKDGIVLNEERDKMKQLWEKNSGEAASVNKTTILKYDPKLAESYSNLWCTEDIVSEVVKSENIQPASV